MQRWCNVKPFCVCIYFRTYCWWPCYDLVETVVWHSPLLWTTTSLSYVKFLLLLMLFSLSLTHRDMHTIARTHAHTCTRRDDVMVSHSMFVLILGPIAGGLLWPCGACDGTFASTLDSNFTQLYFLYFTVSVCLSLTRTRTVLIYK